MEGDNFEPVTGYYFDILDVDPYYGEVQFSITKNGYELLNWVYYDGSTFYYDDAYLTISFTIVDTVTEIGTDYVIISDYYIFDKVSSTGTIAVSSNPSGASVYLNGFYYGETGFESFWIYDVQEGYHEIELVKDGYYTSTESIYVYAGEIYYYSKILEPFYDTTGIISVSSDPSGASVYLNGLYYGETSYESVWIYDVQEGYHEIELVKDGYYTSTESIYVYAGETNYYSNTLDKKGDPLEFVYMIIGLLFLLVIAAIPLLFIVWLLTRKKKPKKIPPTPVEPVPEIEKTVAPPVSPTPVDQSAPISIKSAFSYLGAIIQYKIKVENHSPEPIGDLKVMIFAPDVFLAKERDKSISMLEPEEGKTVTFELRPTGECGDCMISGSIEYYDYGTKKRSYLEIDSKLVSIVCPVLSRHEIDEDAWRQATNELIKAEEDSKDLDIPAENLFDMVTRVLKDMNLYMIKPEITNTPQLFTGVARFYAVGAAGLRYAAYVEVVGKRKSRLIIKAWAEKEESLTGFYHKMLEEIEKRTDIKIFVDEGVHQYNISTTTIQDSVVQRSNIDASIGGKKRRCPNCDREVDGDKKFCMGCGEKLA